jgi:prepilin-type N-terminal cleavage/methylation domain-containing protein
MKKAFTLAEVLITIGVIGIVAALTIPNLVIKYYKVATVQNLKKNYATMQNVIKSSIDDNGDLDSWDYTLSGEEFAKTYILPYFNGATKLTKNYKIMPLPAADGSNAPYFLFGDAVRYILNNGTVIIVYTSTYHGYPSAMIWVDLNGYSNPNIVGKDIFVYAISRPTPKKFDFYTICMYSGCKVTRELMISNCSHGTSSNWYTGQSCGALIKYDGWKMADDYPL